MRNLHDRPGTTTVISGRLTAMSTELGDLYPYVILTGAGLSRNWDGFLATEMWAAILSQPQIQESDRLRRLLLDQTNFEVALHYLRRRPDFDAAERRAFELAVIAAFEVHDQHLCHALKQQNGPHCTWNSFQDAIFQRLDYRGQERGRTSFIFTLNQDLLVERGFRRSTPRSWNMPGVAAENWFPWGEPGEWILDPYSEERHSVKIAAGAASAIEVRGRLNYVKLHGSYNWRTEERGEEVMVMGASKEDQIQGLGLLSSYFELFRSVCLRGGVRLLVIGYGFADLHVNAVLAHAVSTAGLKLVIVDPRGPAAVKAHLAGTPGGAAIWDGVTGFFSRPINTCFGGRELGGEASRLVQTFFRGDE